MAETSESILGDADPFKLFRSRKEKEKSKLLSEADQSDKIKLLLNEAGLTREEQNRLRVNFLTIFDFI